MKASLLVTAECTKAEQRETFFETVSLLRTVCKQSVMLLSR